jgi:hypothetical protein
MLYMFQWLYTCCKRLFKIFHLFQTYVASVFIWMLQLLYIYVASVCCKCFTYLRYMLQKCFMLQYINRCKKRANAEAVSTCAMVPTCAASEVGVGAPHLHAHQQPWARNFTRTNMLGRATCGAAVLQFCMRGRLYHHAGQAGRRGRPDV